MSIHKIAIIGSGFSGLSAACYLAQQGHSVVVFEKNKAIGGRARVFETEGFKFDMGPSWYWMPDVFEKFFADFGKKFSSYYELKKLSPGFQVIFSENENFKVKQEFEEIKQDFEQIEKGSGKKLQQFIDNAEYKYKMSMDSLVYKPCYSFLEFLRWDIIREVFKTNLFSPLSREVRNLFQHHKLRQIIEFPVIFLGAMADKIPALYSIMNYAAMKQGTFYPMGGMVKIVEAMHSLAIELGVEFMTDAEVEKIIVKKNKAIGIVVNTHSIYFDAVISSADYHHTESKLLDEEFRNYDDSYWASKTFAPSSILFYLGIDKTIPKLEHHNLFFDTDFQQHTDDIYKTPQWTNEPLFYVCCPSKTDGEVAPKGKENLFILIPYAIQLEESEEIIDAYFDKVMSRLEKFCDTSIREHIVFRRNFTAKNFIEDYHSYKGNAYGLANTLMQTAFLKPKIRNKKIKNLFYTGQLTVPGPGIPPSIISGKIVATELHNYLKQISV